MGKLMNEKWKPVRGYEERYEVSNYGRVRSIARFVPHPTMKSGYRWWPSRIMKPYPARSADPLRPYQTVGLYDQQTKQNKLPIHILVLEAFRGPRPSSKHLGMHLDDDPTNNFLWNLRWGTHKENTADMYAKGRNNKDFSRLQGELQSSAKLTNRQAIEAAMLIRAGWMVKDIAAKFGVSSTTISHIKSGRYWNHVTHMKP
jgi:uncharacterized protein YerC